MEGVVVLQGQVDSSGSLVDYKVVSGVNPLLNRAAITAFRKSTFSPAINNGIKVSRPIEVAYPFDLSLQYMEKERRERPPIDWSSPRISEVGKLVEGRGSAASSIYEYDNFRFYGDMTLDLYFEALVAVEPHLSPEEKVLSFHHPLAFRSMEELSLSSQSDLYVSTCTDPWSENCGKGRIYRFFNSGGVYSLVSQEGTRTTWQH